KSAACSARTTNDIEININFVHQLFVGFCRQGITSTFGDQVEISETFPKICNNRRISLLSVRTAIHIGELHSMICRVPERLLRGRCSSPRITPIVLKPK